MSTLSPISTDRFRPVARPKEPAPTLVWLEISSLVVDHRYQREITPAGSRAIQKIAESFTWAKFEPILATCVEGFRFAIVDGQHRVHAAAVCGLSHVPAMVVPMSLTEQALGFAAVNRDRIRIDNMHIYRAELAAGDRNAIAARDAVLNANCRLATANSSSLLKKPGVIYAVGLIRKMVRQGEAEAVTAGLRAIRESEAGQESESYIGPVLKLWLQMLAENQLFLRLPLAAIFDEVDLISMLDSAKVEARLTGRTAQSVASDQLRRVLSMAIEEARG